MTTQEKNEMNKLGYYSAEQLGTTSTVIDRRVEAGDLPKDICIVVGGRDGRYKLYKKSIWEAFNVKRSNVPDGFKRVEVLFLKYGTSRGTAYRWCHNERVPAGVYAKDGRAAWYADEKAFAAEAKRTEDKREHLIGRLGDKRRNAPVQASTPAPVSTPTNTTPTNADLMKRVAQLESQIQALASRVSK